jgi:hypothetical protein
MGSYKELQESLISGFSKFLKFTNRNFMTKKGKHVYITHASIANNELNPSLELLHFNYISVLKL